MNAFRSNSGCRSNLAFNTNASLASLSASEPLISFERDLIFHFKKNGSISRSRGITSVDSDSISPESIHLLKIMTPEITLGARCSEACQCSPLKALTRFSANVLVSDSAPGKIAITTLPTGPCCNDLNRAGRKVWLDAFADRISSSHSTSVRSCSSNSFEWTADAFAVSADPCASLAALLASSADFCASFVASAVFSRMTLLTYAMSLSSRFTFTSNQHSPNTPTSINSHPIAPRMVASGGVGDSMNLTFRSVFQALVHSCFISHHSNAMPRKTMNEEQTRSMKSKVLCLSTTSLATYPSDTTESDETLRAEAALNRSEREIVDIAEKAMLFAVCVVVVVTQIRRKRNAP